MKKFTTTLLLAIGLLVGFTVNAQAVNAATLNMSYSDYWYDRAKADGSEHHSWHFTLYDMDGEVAYCIQPNVKEGTHYNQGSWEDTGLPNSIKERILLIGYYGYTYPGHQTLQFRAATQGMIWDTIVGGGANVAKPLHVGHLRSAIIGEGLKRLAKELGHDVIGDVHLGDWGRPLGIVISEIKRRNPGLVYFDENYTGEYPSESPVTMDDLNEIYPTASAAAKEDEERMREAREATAILQNEDRPGHRGYYALWQHIINESIKDLKQSYDKLGVNFELWRGESDCIKSIPEMMDIFAKKNLLRQSNGATVMDVDEPTDSSPVPPLILKTQSDSVGYQTTELATIYERVKEFEPDEIWYVVDGRQEMHFKQVFRGAYKSGIVPEDMKLRFIGFGTMNGKDGKPFKTRDGGVMKLSDLLELVQKSSEKRLEESGVQFSEEEKKDSAYKIADATIKYADALSNRETDYIFDIDKFVETQGKTGPYILYSAVRINSLLKKALEQGIEPGKIQEPSKNEERMLMLTISRLPDIVDTAFENKSLTEIANYLYELNSAYNSFYNTTKVIGEQDKDKQKSWIQLSSMVGKINKKLLDTMAIEEPERM